jgi:hypothetical protein
MQRPEAKNPPERPLLSAETGNSKIGVKNTRRNGLFSIDDGFRSSGRLDGSATGIEPVTPSMSTSPSHSAATRVLRKLQEIQLLKELTIFRDNRQALELAPRVGPDWAPLLRFES